MMTMHDLWTKYELTMSSLLNKQQIAAMIIQ